jgi:hypothetical protein
MTDDRYEAPRVEDRTPVADPLNTANSVSEPRTVTPAWRRKTEDQ